MYIISHKAKFLSTSFTKKPLLVDFVKSFVFQFIPVFWNTKVKHSRLVTATLCFNSTRPDSIESIFDYTCPGTFFPVNSLKLTR